MPFSQDVKEELSLVIDSARHCRIAELLAIVFLLGKTVDTEEGMSIVISSENSLPIFVSSLHVEKLFGRLYEIKEIVSGKKSVRYEMEIPAGEDTRELLETVRVCNINGDRKIDPLVIMKKCCKAAFLRGAFLATGTISDPSKSYHFEILCREETQGRQIRNLLSEVGVEAGLHKRKKYYAVYIKGNNSIFDMLGLMGARKSLLEYENMRIVREVRGDINRKVNCETANIEKTVCASTRQINDILFIMQKGVYSDLPDTLIEIAKKRLEYPDATLTELGNMLDPPVGKSGANHRLRKLSLIAANLRKAD